MLDVVLVGTCRILFDIVGPDVNVLPMSLAACLSLVSTFIPRDPFEPRGQISVALSKDFISLFLLFVLLLVPVSPGGQPHQCHGDLAKRPSLHCCTCEISVQVAVRWGEEGCGEGREKEVVDFELISKLAPPTIKQERPLG